MAFVLQYLGRIENTQQYDKTYNPATGAVTVPLPSMWVYNAGASGANDTAAAVEAANYFNGASGYLSVGDTIYVYSNDPAFHFLSVTANAAGNVTTGVIV